MRRFRIILSCFFIIISLLLILISSGVKAQTHQHLISKENQTGQASSYNKIESAYHRKEITLDEKILNHVYAMFDSKKLPDEYQSKDEEYCGTWVLEEVWRNWNNLSRQTRNILVNNYRFKPDGIWERPPGLDQTRSTEHFKIHYSVTPGDTNAVSTIDYNGNGTPDYVETLMYFLEEIWNYEILTMGYYPPPSDGTAGGDDKYDIYLAKISAWGMCSPETMIGNNPNSPFNEVNAWTSFVVIRNNFQSYEWSEASILKNTAAHEYYHSIQNGYDAWEPLWIKEATATWCEDEVYDDENINLRWLTYWFDRPWIPLDANDSEHWYGSWIFFKYLSESVNRDLIRTIWEKAILYIDSLNTNKSFEAIDDALSTVGTTFKSVFEGFTTANFFPSEIYEEGESYPKVNQVRFAINNLSSTFSLNRRASHYFIVSPNIAPKGNDIINITFTPIDHDTKFSVQVITRKGSSITKHPFATNFSLTPTKDLDEIAVVVMNYDTTGTNNIFTINIKTNSLIHRLSSSLAEGHRYLTFSLSGDRISWIDKDGKARYFNGNDILRVSGLFYEGYFRPVLDNNTLAYQDVAKMGDIYTNVVKYDDGSMVKTIGSSDWNSMPGEKFHNPDLLLDKGKTVFTLTKFYEVGYPKYLAISDNGGAAQLISDPQSMVRLYDLDNGQVIWFGSQVFWYNGTTNVLPPTKHNGPDIYTFPRLSDGKMAWLESYEDTPPAPDNLDTWELYYFDGTTVNRITNDSIVDGIGGDYRNFYCFDFKNGKIAWPRRYSSLFGDNHFFVYLYENGNIKILWDSIAQGPAYTVGSPIKIDKKRGYVAWRGHFPAVQKTDNIYLYDGKSIFPIIPKDLNLSYEYFELDDGKIVFAAYKTQPYIHDYSVYLYEYDSTLVNINETPPLVESFRLEQNYPNPFNTYTTIKFSIPKSAIVKLEIFNFLGQKVACLINGELQIGDHQISWNANRYASGVYFYRLHCESFSQTKKLVLIK